jgi:hypothetical protein
LGLQPRTVAAQRDATATWALLHRLAFLHLDGKLNASKPSAVTDRVTTAIDALLTATSIAGHSLHPQ